MTTHVLPLQSINLRGSFSSTYTPAAVIDSGDTLKTTTPDIEWGYSRKEGEPYQTYHPASEESDPKHPVIGPVYIKEAEPGMTVEIHIKRLVPGWYGRNWAGGAFNWQNEAMHLTGSERIQVDWLLDRNCNTASASFGNSRYTIPLRPFLGLIGLQPSGNTLYPTPPPYFTGGNIDCRQLTEGSRLFLPVAVSGGALYLGDGHAAQGDGEVSGTAVECPMDEVEVEVTLHKNMEITQPYAETASGLLTFGFDKDLNTAASSALGDLIEKISRRYGLKPQEAAALASAAADLHITQVVNGVKGVHAILPHHLITTKLQEGNR
ncbi:acetamidase/formamidase family protein [Alkalicoccus saliphilus]|uniref:Acetamidase n=1 Tax=Alkalicoccus saliphilus TaxID=200989 RepID=A0A2T4UA09_9BACI|nr:acetamidase/formamidase family protein [Alkalicoccus saliphilus]PTL40220.1 acetamidase [Alkalicoccus saliphilus]